MYRKKINVLILHIFCSFNAVAWNLLKIGQNTTQSFMDQIKVHFIQIQIRNQITTTIHPTTDGFPNRAVIPQEIRWVFCNALITKNFFQMLNFICFEKATNFCEIFTLLLTVCTVVKRKVKISQNFVAFSEYMNFTYVSL